MTDHTPIETDQGALEAMAQEVKACNQYNGWYDAERSFGDDIALLHSEVSEMFEEYRAYGTSIKFRRADGEFDDTPVSDAGALNKPIGIASEAADILIRLLDTCDRYDIDLFAEFRQKLDYNWTRGHRHGGKLL